MGWNEDFAEGRRRGGWSNQPGAEAFNAGAAAAQRERDAQFAADQRRRFDAHYGHKPGETTAPAPGGFAAPGAWGGASGGGGGTPIESLGDAARIGAWGLAIVFGLYALLQSHALSWAQIGMGAAAAALLGAVAGAVLYLAMRLLLIALRIAAVLLLIGLGLHLLGVVDLFDVAGRLLRAWS